MNTVDGVSSSSFWLARLVALFDGLAAPVVMAAIVIVLSKFQINTLLVRRSLRFRAMLYAVLIIAADVLLWYFKVPLNYLLGGSAVLYVGLVYLTLTDLTKVGIANAFDKTSDGISAERSLSLVKTDLDFLGIGAKKLVDSPSFDKMLDRSAANKGRLRFLLSHPDNNALGQLARTNGKQDLAYQGRVRESVRELYHKAGKSTADIEIRVYSLTHKVALPHFRLLFIDQTLCVFSQIVWNAAEGLDNPQMIVKKTSTNPESSFYHGYASFFEDLWNAPDTKKVDDAMIGSWL
jgi:hypothetical protein